MPIPLRARRAFPYAGHRLKEDQDFDALTQKDAAVLITIGHAEARPPQLYATRVMTAEVTRPVTQPVTVDLERMEVPDLRALAVSLGVRVHHWAGAAKIRSAIREARGE